MIDVREFELSVGPRTLMTDVSFRISAGDKIGLVGRNGAGKTTMTKVLAGISDDRDGHTFSGTVERSGEIGYLPQDPRSGDPKQTARRRILDARGLGELVEGMRLATEQMGEGGAVADDAMRRYSRLEDRFLALGGYAAEAEGAAIASNLQLPDRILDQPLETLSGGQRRRIELARILFSGADTMLLDEPTNHL
ncbi:ABC transporter ATP-binding protein, partial [Agrococcus lahaulensis]